MRQAGRWRPYLRYCLKWRDRDACFVDFDDKKTVHAWKLRGVPDDVIADAIGCSVEEVAAVKMSGPGNHAPLPSEMDGVLAEVRSSWRPCHYESKRMNGSYHWLD